MYKLLLCWRYLRTRYLALVCIVSVMLGVATLIVVGSYMKIVPDQIAPWVPGGLTTLGTDGFGRSDTRSSLRRFFEVDAETIAIATLYALYQQGALPAQSVDAAIGKLAVHPDKPFPFYL